MRRLLVVLSVALVAGAALCGCSVSVGSSNELTVAAADLQKDIAAKLENAGQKPQSVTCQGDLKGVVDATTDCEVDLGEANTFQARVKVTKVDGSTVSYDSSPALTKEQLEKQVGILIGRSNNLEIQSVSCQSGLDGVEGNTADCTIETADESLDAVAKVTKVEGLTMNFDVNPA